MTNAQMITMILTILGVVSAEIGVVLIFMLHSFSELKQQINQLIQYLINHEGKIAMLDERTGGKKAS